MGIVLYEIINLKPSFRAQNTEGLYNKVIKGQLNKIPERFSNELFEIVKLLMIINSDLRPSCDDIFKNKIVQKRIEYFKSFGGKQVNEDKVLSQTFLSDKLPKPNYAKSIQNIKNNSKDKVNTNNYGKISLKSDNSNEQIKNIKVLPKIWIQEPKISNQKLKLDININKNNSSIIYSGSHKLIINPNNHKKSFHRIMSDLPFLKPINHSKIKNDNNI